MYDLGLRLREIRTQRNLTQKDLAKRINKSISAISSYESNAQMPPLDVLISIATTLNVSLDYFVNFDTSKSITTTNLTPQQRELLEELVTEFTNPTHSGAGLSVQQVHIIQKLFLIFSE